MWSFAKGHGTLNDFVLITDPDDRLAPTDAEVRFLCDRRAGIGGDGLLRAVRARHIPGWTGDPDLWFMDYRNADASIAEMCGNGLRVFLRYLVEEGLADGPAITVGTRAGVRTGELLPDGRVRVTMGPPVVDPQPVTVRLGEDAWAALPVDVGNPHAVSFLADGQELGALDLSRAPRWTPADRFPNGVNCEFVEVAAPRHVRMRVFERGVGETCSCGTGTVAVAAATAFRDGETAGSYRVDVPGGTVQVDLGGPEALLTGPAVIVARGRIDVRRAPDASPRTTLREGTRA